MGVLTPAMLARLFVVLIVVAPIGMPPQTYGQLPKVDDSRLGVDGVRLKGGLRLYGFVMSQDPDSVQMAIEREWLQQTHPAYFAELEDRESKERKQARDEFLGRIEQWLSDRQDDDQLKRYLELELERARENDNEESDESSQFAISTIPREQILELKIRAPSPRKIAGLAYQSGLDRVVITPASILKKRLLDSQVDPQTTELDLTDRLPSLQRTSKRQWAAKQALVEFQMREPLEYQGTDSILIRKGEDAVDAAGLMRQLMGGGGMDAISQIGRELGLPEFQPKNDRRSDQWWKKTTREAESDGFRGVLITRLHQNLLSPDVRVDTHFFAMASPGNWFQVVTFRGTANANNQSQERIDRIKEDPQVKQILGLTSQLGLGAGGQLDQALRQGAATEVAMQNASGDFYTFLSQHTRSLDGPPVPVESEAQ